MWCYAPVLGFEGEAGGGVENDELESQPPSTHAHIFLPQSPLRRCVWGRPPPCLCVTTVLIFHFVQAPAFDGHGNEASNDCDTRPRWGKSSAGPRREAALETERCRLELSADCAFNAPAMLSWSAARLEGQTHTSAAQAIQKQWSGFHSFLFVAIEFWMLPWCYCIWYMYILHNNTHKNAPLVSLVLHTSHQLNT